MGVTFVGGMPKVFVSQRNKVEFAHVMGAHALMLDGNIEMFHGTYAQCVQFRDDLMDLDDATEIVPWFDTTSWDS